MQVAESMWAKPSCAGTEEPRHCSLSWREFVTGWIRQHLQSCKMKFLWILESGIHCLIFLLLSVFLLAASLLTTNSTHSLGSDGPSTAAVSTTGANITMPGETTQDPGRRPLTFWAIILICLTVSGFFIGGYVGCCFLWKNNIF
ncbi:hypothetical protein L345_04270, partial [Ophiophagus hannah]